MAPAGVEGEEEGASNLARDLHSCSVLLGAQSWPAAPTPNSPPQATGAAQRPFAGGTCQPVAVMPAAVLCLRI